MKVNSKHNAPTQLEPCVVHVDINSYFATLLQQENPFLRNKPVGVIKSDGRTILIAVSKEAKARGVPSPCSVREARQICPEIQFVPAQFDFTWAMTVRLRDLFESLVPNVEIFSLDEAFLHLTDCRRLYPDPWKFAEMVQRRIKEELGEWVTCNVGIGPNRFVAKIASGISPKGSIRQVTYENMAELLTETTFADTCGIGYRLGARLESMGVTNPYQINLLSDEVLQTEFGPYFWKELRKMGQGEEPALLKRIDHLPHMKSVGRSITGFELTRDEESIKKVLFNLVEETCYKARKMKLMGRYVAIYLRGGRGEEKRSWGQHVTLQHYINRSPEMFELVYHRMYKSWERDFPIIKFGVCLAMLKPENEVNPQIWPEWERRRRLTEAADKVVQKYGLFSVRPGTLARGKLIRPEVTGFLGDKKFLFG
jgi:DNA polymerase-4